MCAASHFMAPCPFCGEAELLMWNGMSMDRLVTTTDGDLVIGQDGEPTTEDVDCVSCLICDAAAPQDVWNRRAVPMPSRGTLDAYYRADPDFAATLPHMVQARAS